MGIFSRNVVCPLCRKIVTESNLLSLVYVGPEYSRIQSDILLCPDCASLAKQVHSVAYAENEKNEAMVKQNIQQYKNITRNQIIQRQKQTQNTILKDLLENLIIKADENVRMNQYVSESYSDILRNAKEKIAKVYTELPANAINIGMESYASDKDFFYRMRYGYPVSENKEIEHVPYYQERVNIVGELIENVLRNECIVDKIKMNDIEYFQEKGEVSYSANVSGGKAGDTNVGGAIVGGMLFGVAGVLVGGKIGAKTKSQSIYSETIEHDNRVVVLRYRNNDGDLIDETYGHAYYDVFNKLIPEKEYSYVKLHKNQSTSPVVNTNNAGNKIPVEELKQLKKLLDMGVITEEDFETKKKQLLGI